MNVCYEFTVERRLISIIETVKSSSNFHRLCRGDDPSAFTRNRKMPLPDLFLAMLSSRGITSSAEMHAFNKRAGIFDVDDLENKAEISGSGYLKARKKFNPDAILHLIRIHLRKFYDSCYYRTADTGDLLLAIDGTTLMIYNTPYTHAHYKKLGRTNTEHTQVGIGVSVAEDVLNGMSFMPVIKDARFDEVSAATEQLLTIRDCIGTAPYIVIMDRGYPSLKFFCLMYLLGIRFIVRLSSKDFKEEQLNMKSGDEDICIEFTKTRLKNYRNDPDYEYLLETGKIKLRFVKVKLSEETTEYLATNLLDREKYPQENFKDYYHSRWSCEEKIGHQKNAGKIENFNGYTDVMITQDVYMAFCISNLVSDFIVDLCEDMKKINAENNYKHPRKIDRALALGVLKEDIADVWTETDPNRRIQLIHKMKNRMKKNLSPVRDDRSYSRREGTRKAKYSLPYRPTY